jgi:hypothetical protein
MLEIGVNHVRGSFGKNRFNSFTQVDYILLRSESNA